MIKQISIRDLKIDELNTNLYPHAIINKSITYFRDLGITFVPDSDDLGDCDTHQFMLEYFEVDVVQHSTFTQIPFMIVHRDNYPMKDVMNIELPLEFNEEQVDLALTKILAVFDLSDKDVYWKQGEYYDNITRKVNRNRKMKIK